MAETKAQKATVERVMHEWKHGELKGADGEAITDRKQAVAVALSEAGHSNRATPRQNRRNLARAKANAREGRTGEQEAEGKASVHRNRSDLYAEAKRRGVAGRSRMSKAQLERALRA